MAIGPHTLTVGLPRMRKEPGERRDFLPPLVGYLARHAGAVVVEHGIGSTVGYHDDDYTSSGASVKAGTHEDAYAQDVVVVLRCPNDDDLSTIRRGATLVSMLHFPTRPARVDRLREEGIEAVAMDCIVDDRGERLVEESREVAWNAIEVSFDTLADTYPGFTDPGRPPIHVTVLGAGRIGRNAVEAATKYGRLKLANELLEAGVPGVEVVTLGRNLSGDPRYMEERLRMTDLLVDTTLRSDPRVPIVRNEWLALMPEHAVVCDCVVDPYQLETRPPTVRGIEGIPQGNLDQIVFPPDDPAWDLTVPGGIPHSHRRTVVSCYSWPGVHPEVSMSTYGVQLAPLLETLLDRGGVQRLRGDGSFHERALLRGSLNGWAW
jgi:alanine dehydrogenase